MTNEEAIRVLGRMLDEFCNEDSYAPECKYAVDMAIEALKAQSKHDQNTPQKQPDLDTLGVKTGETCEDVISRRDAIDALRDAENHAFNSYYKGLIKAHKIIADLPSAKPEPDIIACGDCKHWICHDKRCGYWNHGVKPLDWCCHGERRTNGFNRKTGGD